MNAVGGTMATLCLAAVAALASAQEQDLEPRVQTSSAAAPAASSPSEPATGNQPTAGRVGTRNAPAAGASAVNGTAKNTAASGTTPKGAKGSERVQLDATQISGNRELPRVMYVVPWRKPELGEFAGRPPNSLLEEALTPVDRDVFRRQNRYYAALQQQANPNQPPPGTAGERAAPPGPKDEQ